MHRGSFTAILATFLLLVLFSGAASAGGFSGPFSFMTDRWNNQEWYCSKVVFRAYHDAAGINLDADGGYWIYPGDIRWDLDTMSVRVWK